jgi:ribosomal-protein-alanine N-acetyltransferase
VLAEYYCLMIWLETERLLFRDHELGDLEAHCEIESDPIYRWPQIVHPRAEIERGFRERWMRPKELGLRATVFKPDRRYIGVCGLYPHREDYQGRPDEATIAFYIARPYWHRGIATEAGRAWVAHGFEQLGLRRIEAGINAANGASLRVIEKLGFRWVESGGDHGIRWHNFELINPVS